MFTVLSPRFKKIILFAAVLLGISVTSFASAAVTDACFKYIDAQDYARAEVEAKKIVQRKRPKLERIERRALSFCLARSYYAQGKLHEALPVFQEVESLSESSDELAIAYNYLGAVNAMLGNLDLAELYDQRALKFFKELNLATGQAQTLNNLGDIAKKRGDASRALSFMEEALVLEPVESAKATIMNNIATIYSDRKDYPKAVGIMRSAIDITRKDNAHQTALLQINLAMLLIYEKDLLSAEKELTVGYNASHLLGDKKLEALACSYFVSLAVFQENMPLAYDWAKKTELLSREIGDTVTADAFAKLLARKRD
jgi:tetratricopeptide (TPR) repeat protein